MMNQIRPTGQDLTRRTYIHTHIHRSNRQHRRNQFFLLVGAERTSKFQGGNFHRQTQYILIRYIYMLLCVTIDGVRIGEWVYWSLIYTTKNYKQLQRHG
jgi:hypothetical protein